MPAFYRIQQAGMRDLKSRDTAENKSDYSELEDVDLSGKAEGNG